MNMFQPNDSNRQQNEYQTRFIGLDDNEIEIGVEMKKTGENVTELRMNYRNKTSEVISNINMQAAVL